MSERDVLTTAEAAALVAVAPSTVKRWADEGLLQYIRTAGGHRRFERSHLEEFIRQQRSADCTDAALPLVETWTRSLVGGKRHEIDGLLLEARARHGAWYRVADELGAVLEAIGEQWACGTLTIAEEHLASEALGRALTRISDAIPSSTSGPRCVLACAADDEHTLGLSLAELTLREVGWAPLWLGRSTPIAELVAFIDTVGMVALSASSSSNDDKQLRTIVRTLGGVCARRGIPLVLGGRGAWPPVSPSSGGLRITSFAAFHDYLVGTELSR